MKHQIHIQSATTAKTPTAQKIRQWASHVLSHCRQTPGELTIRIVDSAEIQQLNDQFRHQDKPTNVIAFPFDATAEIDDTYLGDIAICAEVVATEAQQQHKTFDAHFAHMVIHGTLHLLGFDHQTEAEAEAMEALEIQLLAQLHYDDPYHLKA